jgi:hypothetical protein
MAFAKSPESNLPANESYHQKPNVKRFYYETRQQLESI